MIRLALVCDDCGASFGTDAARATHAARLVEIMRATAAERVGWTVGAGDDEGCDFCRVCSIKPKAEAAKGGGK